MLLFFLLMMKTEYSPGEMISSEHVSGSGAPLVAIRDVQRSIGQDTELGPAVPR